MLQWKDVQAGKHAGELGTSARGWALRARMWAGGRRRRGEEEEENRQWGRRGAASGQRAGEEARGDAGGRM